MKPHVSPPKRIPSYDKIKMDYKKYNVNIVDHIEDYNNLPYLSDPFNCVFLNFPESFSMKVNTAFSKLRKKSVNKFVEEIEGFIKDKFYLEDAQYSEKVIILTYKYLTEKDCIIVNTGGMAFDSIEYFIEIITKINLHLKKTIFIIKM